MNSVTTTVTLLLVWLGLTMDASADTTPPRWRPSSPPAGQFEPLQTLHYQQLQRLFLQTLHGAPSVEDWQAAGFTLETPAPGLLALQEQHNRGRGLYLFRHPTAAVRATPLFLQAPHQFSDRTTGDIAMALFELGSFSGAAWNSLHRRTTTSSDLAHIDHSPFSAHGHAIAQLYPQALLLQLHGFSQQKRSSPAGNSADLIISSAAARPDPRAVALTRCLSSGSVGEVRLYPRDVKELGGTTNVTAQELQRIGFSGFIHLEMSAPLRQRLLTEPATLRYLASCLEAL